MSLELLTLDRWDFFRPTDHLLQQFDPEGEFGDSAADLGFDTDPDELIRRTDLLEKAGKIALDGIRCGNCDEIL